MKKVLLLIACTFTLGFYLHSPAQNPQKFAVIITSDAPGDGYQGQYAVPNSDYDEFWNDTYLMWEMLVTKFGFSDEKVFVLYATGIDFITQNPRYSVSNSGIPGLTKITDYSASKSHVEEVLEGLSDGSNGMPMITQNDFLFVFTFGHGHFTSLTGGPPYNGVLELLGDDIISDTEFSGLINNIPAYKRLIWMQNCAGGDLATDLFETMMNPVSRIQF